MKPRRRLPAAIFFATFFLYLLTCGRDHPWNDARVMYAVAESLVTRGTVDLASEHFTGQGPGKHYSWFGLLPSAVSIPSATMVVYARRHAPQVYEFVWVFSCHLAPAAFGGLTCLLFFGLCRRHGTGPLRASLATATLALGTQIWLYARYPYSDIIQAACFTGFFAATLAVAQEPTRRRALWLGGWAGLLLNAKTVYAITLLGGAGFLLWELRRQRGALWRVAAFGALSFAPLLFLWGWYNYVRFGSPWLTGYQGLSEASNESTLTGLWGLFFSPGKSLFLYNPPAILGLLALPLLIRQHRKTALLMAILVVPIIVLNASLVWWPGGWCWGPRYLTFAMPVLLLPLCLWLGVPGRPPAATTTAPTPRWRALLGAVASPGGLRGALFAAVFAAGIGVQVLGNLFNWDHFIRISLDAVPQWLGAVNQKGKIVNASDFEDLYPLVWLPPFQPIAGHLWLARHVYAKDPWRVAEADAPWHRYTHLNLNAERQYMRVRFDWWGYFCMKDQPARRRTAYLLVAILCVGLLASAAIWVRDLRRD